MKTKQGIKQNFRSAASLSADEIDKILPFPKPNTDGFFERMEKRDKQLKQQEEGVEQSSKAYVGSQ